MNSTEKQNIVYIKSNDLLQDAQHIIETAQGFAYKAVNIAMLQRNWYMREAAEQTWSTRTLQRNISSQYYFRLLQSHNKDLVKAEMEQNLHAFRRRTASRNRNSKKIILFTNQT